MKRVHLLILLLISLFYSCKKNSGANAGGVNIYVGGHLAATGGVYWKNGNRVSLPRPKKAIH